MSQSDARKPTYDQLSALCAQMAAALRALNREARKTIDAQKWQLIEDAMAAQKAYDALSPDPLWQRVPEMLPPLKRLAALPVEQDFAIGNDRDMVLYHNAGKSITIGDVLDARAALEGVR